MKFWWRHRFGGCVFCPQKQNAPSLRTWLVTYTLSSSSKNWNKDSLAKINSSIKIKKNIFTIVTKVTLSMTAPVNTTTFKHLKVLQWIEYLSALPSPQGNLKYYYIILLANSLQWCLNDHQTVAWITIMLRGLPAQLVDIVSLPPPACICVSSLVLTAQQRDHLSGLSAHVLVQKHPCFLIRLLSIQKNPISINTYSKYTILLPFSECEFERMTRLLLYIHLEGGAKTRWAS